jgi:hypothetical protein
MTSPFSTKPGSLVGSLRPVLRLRKPQMKVGELLDQVESADGPGPVLFILTLPVLMPLPPGLSMVLALPLLLVAPQLIIGRRQVWLPQFLLHRSIKRDALVKLIRRILPPMQKFEAVVHPRLQFLTGRVGAAFVGLACTLIALVLVLPIPFANLVPAIAMCVFALGLTRKDGLLVLGGYALIAVAAGVIYLGVHGFGLGWDRLRALI